jgi:RNA polymerase sigma factor (sigma-70 family)
MSGAMAEQIRRLFVEGTVSGLGEGALLDRFLARRDAAAFEALVARHGPMVLGVCRRLLRDPHDVDDAFQATFLVLVRKGGSLRRRDALGPWLYGVAYRVAARARSRAATRLEAGSLVDPADDGDSPGLLVERTEDALALHEELARLPESYRAPVVLCYLEGLTHDEAAERLRWPVGTVRGRLARARDKLRERLERRGVGPAAIAVASAPTRPPVVPPILLATATRSALQLAEVGVLPGSAAFSLAQGVLGMMAWSSLKTAAAMAAMVLVVGTGVVWSAGQGGGANPKAQAPMGRRIDTARRPGAPRKSSDRSPLELDKSAQPQQVTGDGGDPPIPKELPEGTLPFLGDEDTTAKIRAARDAYDKELAKLTQDNSSQQADVAFQTAQIEAIKRRVGENVTESLKDRMIEGAIDTTALRLERESVKLRERLKELMSVTAEQRSRLDDTERRLRDLRSRPRPTDRIEVQPGDSLIVEVLEALPGRPISGERFVRADGRISLGFYGEIYVAGLSLVEIKEKVILRLRKDLDDETLGLITREVVKGKAVIVTPKPRESSRVFVDIVPRTQESRD